MVARCGQLGTFVGLLRSKVPEPALAGLEALDDLMAYLSEVLARVLRR